MAILDFSSRFRTYCINLLISIFLIFFGVSIFASGCGTAEYNIVGSIIDNRGHPVDGALVLVFFNDDKSSLITDSSKFVKNGNLELIIGFSTNAKKQKEIYLEDIGSWISVADCSRKPLELELIIYKEGFSITRKHFKEITIENDQKTINIGTISILKYSSLDEDDCK